MAALKDLVLSRRSRPHTRPNRRAPKEPGIEATSRAKRSNQSCVSFDYCNATIAREKHAVACCICLLHKMIYGYARVSTHGQTLDAQRAALKAVGAERIFAEKASGAVIRRVQLERMLRAVSDSDMICVTRLDRLARSTRDLLNILAAIAERGATFRSLGDAWADTSTPHGRLMLTVLGGLAEFERELIRSRTSEGRARAKARGQSLGRPFKLTSHQRSEVLRRKAAGESVREIARSYNVSPSTISRQGSPFT